MAEQNGTTALTGFVDDSLDLLGVIDHATALLRGGLRLLEGSEQYERDADLMYAGMLARRADSMLGCIRELAGELELQLGTPPATAADPER